MHEHDAIIVGLGAMGSAAACRLALRGRSVLGLEQGPIPHDRGASHGATRMVRMCYAEHPDYVSLVRRAYDLWRETESRARTRLMHLTGALYLGPIDGPTVGGALEAARRHALPHEMLSRDEVAARFGMFRPPEGSSALFEPSAGFVLPERAVATMAELALRAGADLRGHERVVSWTADSRGVRVRTERLGAAGEEYAARTLVLCAGPWSAEAARDAGARVEVTRQVMAWVWPKRPERFEMGVFPAWAAERPEGGVFYGFPMVPPGDSSMPGLKLALHAPGEPTGPDDGGPAVNAADEGPLRDFLRRVLPDADGRLLAIRRCLYANSADGHFIIDRHPRHANVVIACGFSGHGFKFAPVIGEVLADLASGVESDVTRAARFLSLARFGGVGGNE